MEQDCNLDYNFPKYNPNPEDINMLDNSPGDVRSLGYDIVMNGYELGGGSIRIHQKNMQQQLALNITTFFE